MPATRALSSFMMWNHLAIMHAAHHCVKANYTHMGYLGYLTSALSLLYHRHRERCCVQAEGLAAKLCIILLVCHGVRQRLPVTQSVMPSALVFVLWQLAQRNYERWHPWVHIGV